MSNESLLTVKDLAVTEELDRKAMSAILGGQVKKTSGNSLNQKSASSFSSDYLVVEFSDAWISNWQLPG